MEIPHYLIYPTTNSNNPMAKFNQSIKSHPQPSICTSKTCDLIPKPTPAK